MAKAKKKVATKRSFMVICRDELESYQEGRYDTQAEAEAAARDIVQESADSEVRWDGSIDDVQEKIVVEVLTVTKAMQPEPAPVTVVTEPYTG